MKEQPISDTQQQEQNNYLAGRDLELITDCSGCKSKHQEAGLFEKTALGCLMKAVSLEVCVVQECVRRGEQKNVSGRMQKQVSA